MIGLHGHQAPQKCHIRVNFTDFLHRVLFLVVQVDGDSAFRGVQGFWAAASAAPGACCGKSSPRAFADKIAFELGQCAEHGITSCPASRI